MTNVLFLRKLFKKNENLLVHELEASAAIISSLQDTLSVMQYCVADENTLRLQKETEIKLLNKNLKLSKKENEKKSKKRSKKEDKFKSFNTRNINKRLKRAKEANENTTKEKKAY